MTNMIEDAEIISKYLCQIKKSLPLWLRLRKNELYSILDEIEEHIWEKVIEIADDKEPNEDDIQIAISQMGEPQDIAGRFASISTPHIYISEELYPFYRKYCKILVWSFLLWIIVFVTLNLFIQYYFFQPFQLSLLFFEVLISVSAILTTLYVFVGIIFSYLSITGYYHYKLKKSEIQKLYSNNYHVQKPKFTSSLHIIILLLEIFFIVVNGSFLIWHFPHKITLFLIIIVKCLREFTKRKSIIWQKFLILLDVILMSIIIHIVGVLLYISNNFEPSEVSYYLSTIFFAYICYQLYLFMTFRDRVELYLKKLRLVKHITKKERILANIKKKDTLYTQKNVNVTTKYNYDFEKEIKIYLKKVKKKIPFWLKITGKHDIIEDIGIEIRESILEFEEPYELTKENIKDLFSGLGSIETRISEYKQQRTPKIYISKELWSWYLKVLKAVIIYFIIIAIFISVLQISFNAYFDFNSIFVYFTIFWLIWIWSVILATKIFVFLSLNNFVPGKTELFISNKKIPVKDYIFYIWEFLFAFLFIVIGAILLYYEFIPRYFFMSNRDFILTYLITNFFLLLGVMKSLKIIFKRKKIKLNSILIIFSITLSLLISFFNLYNYHLDYRFIHSSLSLNIFEFIFLPINIEIFYEINHYFFKDKNKSLKL